jgi:hypothetical protein
LFVGYIFPEQNPNPFVFTDSTIVSKEKKKTDLLGQGLSLRNVLMAVGQHKVPPSPELREQQNTGWNLLQAPQEGRNLKPFPRGFLNGKNVPCRFCPNKTVPRGAPRIWHTV